MELNLELILVILTLLTGLIVLFHWLGIRNSSTKKSAGELPLLVDYSKSFFPVLLLVVVLRSFVAEPFRIPSGSMIPTLEIGDFILVKKYSYGIRLPVLHNKVIDTGKPQRGDVVVFRYPPNPKINYIKRLVGLPGDQIKWTNKKRLIINGKPVYYRSNGYHKVKSYHANSVKKLKETLPGDEPHDLILFPGSTKAGEWTVPEGHYFVMGDNRDNSSDSRFWKFVPEENLVGQASLIWMHWNWLEGGDGFQSERIGVAVE